MFNGKPYDEVAEEVPEDIKHVYDPQSGHLVSVIRSAHYPYIGENMAGHEIVRGEIYLMAHYRDGAYQKTEAILVLDK